MRFSLAMAALLCLTIWMSVAHASLGPASDCCIELSNTIIHLSKVKNYTVQHDSLCPIKAIKILTEGGKTLCSDPEHRWTKRAMKKVDDETRALSQPVKKEDESTVQITTAVSPTVKTSPKTFPKTSPKMSPKMSPRTSPKMSPRTSPKMSPKTSPKTSPQRNVTTKGKRRQRKKFRRRSAITKWQRRRV